MFDVNLGMLKLDQVIRDAIILIDRETAKIIDVNEAACILYGYSRNELLNLTDIDISAQPSETKNGMSQVPSNVIRLHKRKDGTVFSAEITTAAVTINGHEFVLDSIRDITARRILEQQVFQEQNLARTYFDVANIMFLVLDAKGKISNINRKGCEILGYEKKNIIGKDWFDTFLPKNNTVEVKRVFRDIVKQKMSAVEYFENTIITASGEELTISWHNTVLKNDADKITGVLSAGNDVTEQKRAEETIAKLASFPRFNPNPIIELDMDGNIKYLNLEARKQIPELETLGTRHTFLANWQEIIKQFSEPNTNYIEREATAGDRCYLQAIQHIQTLQVIRIYCHDVTQRKQAETALHESEEKYKRLFSEIRDSLILYDRETKKLLDMNNAACQLYGYTKEEMLNLGSIVELSAEPNKTMKGMNNVPSNIPLRYHKKKDGTVFPASLTTSVIKVNGRDAVLDATRDITVQMKIEEKLKYMSYHDQLTGLYNRRYFEEVIDQLDTEENLPLSIIMTDINGLKIINDSFGHDHGDKLLMMTAEVFKNGCRSGDIICRLGGDEFAIILPQTDSEETKNIAENLKILASQKSIENIELSISFGYATKLNEKESLADVLANAENYMYRFKLYERSSMRSGTIDIIMNTLFEKSNRESFHSKRVGTISEQIAKKMNMRGYHTNQIKMAGLVHDIGKIGIDEMILNKTDRLTNEEWQIMKKHAESGWRILSSSIEFSDLAQICLSHHEKWDGHGYPNGIKGEEIPVEARIIAVADSYDAMTSDRPYGKKMRKEEAKEELLRCAGSQFDPKIVDVFVNQVIDII